MSEEVSSLGHINMRNLFFFFFFTGSMQACLLSLPRVQLYLRSRFGPVKRHMEQIY